MGDEITCNVLKLAIILVLILIIIIWQEKKSDTFVNEHQKIERAKSVIESVGGAMKENPDMSFNQTKSFMPNLDAVEYRDVKSAVKNGDLSPEKLAAKW
jgi:hypothetical protein